MKRISTDKFKEYIESEPAWASKLTEPLLIWGECELGGSTITHLSPHLHFEGFVDFEGCKKLKVVEGHFQKWANFSGSGVERIGNATFPAPDGSMPFEDGFVCCDLTGTPLMKQNPIEAIKTMTSSSNIKDWLILAQEADSEGWSEVTEQAKAAIKLYKKQAVGNLRKETPMEI
jgi:hypothetical protein